jgi:hypothetical protein
MSNDMRFRVHARLLHEGIGGREMIDIPACTCPSEGIAAHQAECPVRIEIDRLSATIERLREFAWHKFDCEKRCIPIGYHSCTCGYDELMAELEESK